MQAVNHLLRQILTLLLVVVAIVVIAAVLLLDRQPLLTSEQELTATTVKNSKNLLNNLHQSMAENQDKPLVLAANLADLNSALAIASQSLPGFHGQAFIAQSGLHVHLTMPVEGIWGTAYLNTQIEIIPAEGPLTIRKVAIGSLTLPGRMALSFVEWTADQVWGIGEGAALLAKVRSVTLKPDVVTVELARSEGLSLGKLKESGFSLYKSIFGSSEQKSDIEFYYQIAFDYSQQQRNASLVAYLQLLFREAHARTAGDTADPKRAIRENQAVILALAQLLGGENLQMLVNELKREKGAKAPRVTLARRTDLQQHFIYSATIHLLASQHVSHTVGKAKELLDSTPGGSGFSFVDLLADRAGILFARNATRDVASAKSIQEFFVVQDRSEAEIFPSKARLAEGMEQATFELKYKSVNSDDYLEVVKEIDQRLDALPFYQIGREVPQVKEVTQPSDKSH